MRRSHPAIAFERYPNDAICHCRSEKKGQRLLEALQERFASCGLPLQLHPEMTQVVYCRDGKRLAPFPVTQFTFDGYAFRPRMSKRSRGGIFANFSPAVSPKAFKRMRERVKAIGLLYLVHLFIVEIARTLNPILQGWIQYYGRFYKIELIWKHHRYLDHQLAACKDRSTSSCAAVGGVARSF